MLLVRRRPGDLRVPAQSANHAVLDRHGLVSAGNKPNDLWCADFKGEFRRGHAKGGCS